jgi:hypothetical protein
MMLPVEGGTSMSEGTGITRAGRLQGALLLPPVTSRKAWIGWGMVVQVIGAGASIGWLVARAKKDAAVGGLALRATVRMAWLEMLHTPSGIAVLIFSAAVFAIGSVLVARPYVRSTPALLGAVPVAAVAGLLVAGALALLVAVFIAIAMAGGPGDLGGIGGGSGKKKKRDQS